jgi:TonB family protein
VPAHSRRPTIRPARLLALGLPLAAAPLGAARAQGSACTMQPPAATVDHVVQLAARPLVGASVAPLPASDADRARLDRVLRAVAAAVVVPASAPFVPGAQTDFFLPDALSPQPDSLAYPLVRGRVVLHLHADGRVTGTRAVRVSAFPALDSALAAALARVGASGALAGVAERDSLAVALDLTSDLEVSAVQAPLGRVRMPQYRARTVAARSRVAPRYPSFALASGIQGLVVVRFVIDEAGRADPATVHVIRQSRPEFGASVLETLPKLRFAPAMAGGCPVRLQVQQPFTFQR